MAKIFFESKTVSMRLPKVVKMEPIFTWLEVSFLKKSTFFHFPSLKNDFEVEGCSSYYQSKTLIIYNSKHMHNVFIESLDHSRFGFEVACWHFKKKAFFEGSRSSQNEEVFWKVWNQVFTFKLFCNVIRVTWDILSCFVAKLWLDREVLNA